MLSGGSGGAKLARGLYELLGEQLTVVANTADDVEIYEAYVSPDPDLVTYWLADRIDERGWGLAGDSFGAVEMLRELGAEAWFGLGDRDLGLCLERRRRRALGAGAVETHRALARARGVTADVLPMSEQPVRTRVLTAGRWVGLQEFMVTLRASEPIEDIKLDGIDAAAPAPEVLAAIDAAEAIVIGPSNPVISIGPILGLQGMREALGAARAPVVAVSPIVGGAVLKGDRRVPGLGGPQRRRRRDRQLLRRATRRARQRRGGGQPTAAALRHADVERRGARRPGRARAPGSPPGSAGGDADARGPPGQELRARQAAPG